MNTALRSAEQDGDEGVDVENDLCEKAGRAAPKLVQDSVAGGGPPARLAIIDDVAQFDALELEWRTLSASALRPCVFLDWDWQRTWWRVYGRRGDRLHIITLRDAGRLVAVLPLYRRARAFGLGAVLRFIGTGGERGEEVGTEYADLLSCGRDDSEDVQRARVDLVLAHLAGLGGWQRIEWTCLLHDALLLVGARGGDMPMVESSAGVRYRVRLDDGAEAHEARLGSGRVKRIDRARRAVRRDGELRRRVRAADDIESGLSLLETLARARRSGPGQSSTFESARFRRFHRLLCRRWVESGQARLVSYSVGDVDVAALYLFRCREVVHYYQSGFAPHKANRWMPLTLAHLAEIDIAREEGLRFYDLMRGEPPCYKDDFGCERYAMVNVSLFRSRWRRQRFVRLRALRRLVVASLARINIRRS